MKLPIHPNLSLTLIDQAIVSGGNFVTGILLARFLGLENFGRFSLIWLALLFFNGLQQALIVSPLLSLASNYDGRERQSYLTIVVVHQVAFASMTFVLLAVGTFATGLLFPSWELDGLALPLAVAAVFFQLQDFVRRSHFAQGRHAGAAINDGLRFGLQLAGLVLLAVMATPGIEAVLWIVAASAAISALAGLGVVTPLTFDRQDFAPVTRRQWQSARWLVTSEILVWSSGHLFIIAAGAVLGAGAVAGIRAAQQLIGVTHIAFQALHNYLPDQATRALKDGGAEALAAFTRRASLGLIGFTAAVAAVLAVAPDFWMVLLFGDEFAGFAGVMRWFAAIYLILAITLPIRTGLRSLEQTRPIFTSYLIATIFTAIAAYPATIWFGVNGVMGGMLLIQVILVLVLMRGFLHALKTDKQAA